MTTTYSRYFRFGIPDFISSPWHSTWQQTVRDIDRRLYQATVLANVTTWLNSTAYAIGDMVIDVTDGTMWIARVAHTSAASPTSFAGDRSAHGLYWGPLFPTNRIMLTGNVDMYVDGNTGNNLNDGSTPTTAFQTIDGGIAYLKKNIDFQTFTVTLNVADYAPGYSSTAIVGPWVGHGAVKIKGNLTNPQNVPFSGISLGSVGGLTANVDIEGVKFAGGTGINLADVGRIRITGLCDFGVCTGFHINMTRGCSITFASDLRISGGAQRFISATQNCTINHNGTGRAFTFTQPTTFSSNLISLDMASTFVIADGGILWGLSGAGTMPTTTGPRAFVNNNAVLNNAGHTTITAPPDLVAPNNKNIPGTTDRSGDGKYA